MKLALGIGGFGQAIVKSINENKNLNALKKYDTLIVIDSYIHHDFFSPSIITDKELTTVQPFSTPCTLFNFETILISYNHCSLFVGLGGSYSTLVLKTLLMQCSMEAKTKLQVIGVMPFEFEGKIKMKRAQEAQNALSQTPIKSHFFNNQTLIQQPFGEDVTQAMKAFHLNIIKSTIG
ncbi:MAG: hypothetical protein EOM50_23505 [Erysipelotrichia bacterium]|nr:hypothetical protein [Erysipelotrichia bacterium]